MIRPACRDDFMAVCGKPPPKTVKAWTMLRGEQPVAIGGYFLVDGAAVAFTDQAPGLSKREIVRGAKMLMGILSALKLDVVACDGPFGTAVLRHFGFEQHGALWRLAT
jgi:hypothetical protein